MINMCNVRELYNKLDEKINEFEYAQVLAEKVSEKPILDLAQRIITTVDEILPSIREESEQEKYLKFKEDV